MEQTFGYILKSTNVSITGFSHIPLLRDTNLTLGKLILRLTNFEWTNNYMSWKATMGKRNGSKSLSHPVRGAAPMRVTGMMATSSPFHCFLQPYDLRSFASSGSHWPGNPCSWWERRMHVMKIHRIHPFGFLHNKAIQSRFTSFKHFS